LHQQHGFDCGAAVEMNDRGSVANAIENASGSVDNDIRATDQRGAIDIFAFERVRTNDDGRDPAGPLRGDRSRPGSLRRTCLKFTRETIDIGGIPSGPDQVSRSAAGLLAKREFTSGKFALTSR